jgi:hypothetical protein
MRFPAIPNSGATILIGIFFLAANVGNALYAAHGLPPSGGFVFVYYVGFGLALAFWMHADSRRLAVREVLDQGWFVYIAWPVILPYHLFKTRGGRGALTLLGLIGLFVATYLLSLPVFYLVRQGVAPQ